MERVNEIEAGLQALSEEELKAKTGEFKRNSDGSKELDINNNEVPIVNMVNTQAWRLVNIQKKEDVDFNRRKSGGGIAAALAKGASMADDDDD